MLLAQRIGAALGLVDEAGGEQLLEVVEELLNGSSSQSVAPRPRWVRRFPTGGGSPPASSVTTACSTHRPIERANPATCTRRVPDNAAPKIVHSAIREVSDTCCYTGEHLFAQQNDVPGALATRTDRHFIARATISMPPLTAALSPAASNSMSGVATSARKIRRSSAQQCQPVPDREDGTAAPRCPDRRDASSGAAKPWRVYPARYFRSFPAFPASDRAFVAMSFDPRLQGRWEDVIRAGVLAAGLQPHRVDLSVLGDSILTEIMDGVAGSRLVLADVTTLDGHRNANVMYELGMSHAVRQPEEVLILRSDSDRLPFDTATLRVVTYNPDEDRKSVV